MQDETLFARLKAIAGIRSTPRRDHLPVYELPRLQSARLVLRTLTSADTQAVYDVIEHSRSHFSTWFTWAHDTTLAAVRQNLEESHISMVAGTEWHYGIFERVECPDGGACEGKFLGRIGLSEIDQRGRSAELGYWIDIDAHGKGLMTEAVKLLLGFVLSSGRQLRIDAYTDVDNGASQRVLLKCGFRQTGRITRAVKHPLRGWRDQYGFVLLSNGR